MMFYQYVIGADGYLHFRDWILYHLKGQRTYFTYGITCFISMSEPNAVRRMHMMNITKHLSPSKTACQEVTVLYSFFFMYVLLALTKRAMAGSYADFPQSPAPSVTS